MRVVAPVSRSWTNTSRDAPLSPSTRFVASEPKAEAERLWRGPAFDGIDDIEEADVALPMARLVRRSMLVRTKGPAAPGRHRLPYLRYVKQPVRV